MTQDHIISPLTEGAIIKKELTIVHTFLDGMLAGSLGLRTQLAIRNVMFRLDNISAVLDTMIEEGLEGEEGK